MNYRINWDEGVFAVPDGVAESLKLASGKAVKVLVYYLKYREMPEDPSEIGVTEEDIEDAVNYWMQVGVLKSAESGEKAEKMSTQKKSGVKIIAQKPVSPAAVKTETADNGAIVIKPQKALLPTEITDRINSSKEIDFLFKQSESILGRPLSFDDQRTILWIYDHLGMSADIIIMLIAQCCSMGRNTMAKIESTAKNWHDKNITTHEQAENELLLMQKAYSFEGQVKSRMGIQTDITPNQRTYVEQWAADGISVDLVEKAYYINMEAKGRIYFPYINAILKKWHENGVETVAQADEFDSRSKPAPAASGRKGRTQASAPVPTDEASQPSFDISLMFERAMNAPVGTSSGERKDQ